MKAAAINAMSREAKSSDEEEQGKKSKPHKITPATISKVDKKKTKEKKPKGYDQVRTIKPDQLRKLIHLKTILIGPPDAEGMASILDRLNILIKGKKVSRVLFSELLDDWQGAFSALSEIDAGLTRHDPLAEQDRFNAAWAEQHQYNRDSNQERVNNFIERERHRAIVYQERRSAFAALEADRALRKFQRSRMPDQTKGGTKAK